MLFSIPPAAPERPPPIPEASADSAASKCLAVVNYKSNTPVVYKLTVKNLKGIAMSGSGSINGKALATDSMKIELSGSGEITTAGSTNHMEVVISGSGNVRGEGFKSKDARVEIDGSGSATVAASERLDVNINGSGNVEYIGDPMVSTSKHGSGNVNKRQ